MRTLLGYIGKEKHADSLVEKLMLRFEAASDAAQWRNLAFCLTQVWPDQHEACMERFSVGAMNKCKGVWRAMAATQKEMDAL